MKSPFPDCQVLTMPQRSMKEFPISLLRELFDYNSDSGVLTWIKPPKNHPRMMGKPAGSIRDGYLMVQIGGSKIGVHRVCFAMHYGRWPSGMIDHINRNPLDNSISNLRECSHSENVRNHGRVKNGSGLPVGVRTNASGRFSSRIRFNGRLITLGTFNDIESASNAYQAARKTYFGNFA